MKHKIHTLTNKQRELLIHINDTIAHSWNFNIESIITHGSYTDAQKNLMLLPLRKKYIQHLKTINS